MNDSPAIDPERVKRLLEGVGRCLWIYQRIEILLKVLLPHMADPDKEDPDPWNLPHWRSLIDSRHTLGQLIKTFASKQSSDDPAAIERYLETLVDQRNDLVHHFFTGSPGTLTSPKDLDDALAKIRNKIDVAKPMLENLEAMTHVFVGELEQTIRDDTRDLAVQRATGWDPPMIRIVRRREPIIQQHRWAVPASRLLGL